ncbi:hypothetical protein [Arthrobacter sp. HMWF013]|uniref:hypothetical protein n=1 Tax=Arthrobacter sp. HMWF013 TaxID=2056849 RepID=UPI002159CC98|nr:hypothetical protein [Arthrobacter sp. HMWF013]
MNHNALVARFVPIGDGVPACDGPSMPTSPGCGALVAGGGVTAGETTSGEIGEGPVADDGVAVGAAGKPV